MSELPNIVTYVADNLYADASFLEQMAGTYPGDVTGEIRRDAYILRSIADDVLGTKWDEILADYEADRPKITVTIYDQEGNIVSESTQ